MLELVLNKFINEFYDDQIALHNCKVDQNNEVYHIEIELDGLQDKNGAVNLDVCVKFSRRFVAYLDQLIESKDESFALPEELNVENYSIGVASAGTDRLLKLPQDLRRFVDMPVEIKFYQLDEVSNEKEIIQEVCIYQPSDAEETSLKFVTFLKRVKKKGKKKQEIKHFEIVQADLIEARLYLDI